MTEEKTDAAEEFWSASLAGINAPTPLMVDHPPDSRSPAPRATVRHSSDCAASTEEPAFWAAVWALLVGRYSNEDHVLFGHTVNGRVWPVFAEMEWDNSFAAWQSKLSAWIDRALSLPYRPIDELRKDFTLIPASSRMLDSVLVAPGEAEADFTAALVVRIEKSGFVLDFDSRRFEQDAIERMAAHLETLAASVIADPRTSLIKARLLPAAEYDKVVSEWNATEVEFPSDKCLHQLFEERVALQPDAPAVTYDRKTLSYAELNGRANRIAHRLLELGVKRDTPVGVSLRRGTDIAAVFMAIAKAGAGYLPLDPDYPEDRLKFMVEDSAVSVLVTQIELEPLFAACSAVKVLVDAIGEDLDAHSSDNPEVAVSPEDLAYLIYTSGSTGMPKGVMVDHRGRVNNFCDFNRRFSVGSGDRLLGLSSISFDMCAYDVFGTLAAGAELIVGESGNDMNPLAWAELMVAHRATVWHSVPALLEMVVDEIESKADRHPRWLRLVLLGGDWIPVTLPDRVKSMAAKSVQVVSMGGATEVSMDSTIYEIEATDLRWKSIPYGAPMWNQRAYVLDRRMQPVPIGVPGELYLGGIGVGRGYNNRPELTSEKFLTNPFAAGERLYRTGDLCRWRADGNLQILGRSDFQVKIRGFRIELGEIETALRSHPAVREAVVMARVAPNGEQRLVAYIVRHERPASIAGSHSASNGGPDGNGRPFPAPLEESPRSGSTPALRQHLDNSLPHYMIPAAFVYLDSFPLSPNGKVNRRALPEPDNVRPELNVPYVEAADALEGILAGIWVGSLGIDRVGMLDPFLSVGGSSLLATQLVTRVREIFQVQLPVKVCLNGNLREVRNALLVQAKKDGVEVDEIVELYSQVLAMSDSEAQARLEECAG
ncbi:MAG: non-ribosomal peptide synthetase [Woeseiaceae bacterium]